MLNKQTDKTIDWCDWTLNIIGGSCKMGCNYCYMKRIEKRFNKNFGEPFFREDYLKSLKSKKLKYGDKIFIGSSNDMFGDWIPKEWIERIINEIKKYPQYIFQFLTKNPKRYNNILFNNNCLKGCSIDNTKRMYDYIENHFEGLPTIDFISFEPLQELIIDLHLIFDNFKNLKWIIIGADSNLEAINPPYKWADNIIEKARENNIPVWVKDNYKYHTRIKEHAG